MHTSELFERGDFRAALRFLEVSTFVSTLTIFSTFLSGGGLLKELLYPLYLVVTTVDGMAFFYWLIKRQSSVVRTSREVMLMAALIAGFSAPFVGGLLLASWFGPPGAAALVTPLSLGITIYSVRCWKYFWRLGGLRVFLNLAASGLVAGTLGTLLILPLGYGDALREIYSPEVSGAPVAVGPGYPATAPSSAGARSSGEQSIAGATSPPVAASSPAVPAMLGCRSIVETNPTLSRGLVSAEECAYGSESAPEHRASYRYASQEDLDAVFRQFAAGLPSGSCPSQSAQQYTRAGLVAGQVACFFAGENRTAVLWTENDQHGLRLVESAQLSAQDLFDWWRADGREI